MLKLKIEYSRTDFLSVKEVIKISILIINKNDKEYPKKLDVMENKPEKLYCIGNVGLLNKTAYAVIGSRDCSIYGMKVAMSVSTELVKNNYVVVSGLAKGIDAYAHMGALNNTIAVLGSGFKYIYPKENIKLAKQIVEKGGLLISEYALDVKSQASNFPKRNRIIAALSKGVIVVEAKHKSGVFITVDYALSYGKEVYAVPGNILSPKSAGTNQLIKDGAMVYTGIQDLWGQGYLRI